MAYRTILAAAFAAFVMTACAREADETVSADAAAGASAEAAITEEAMDIEVEDMMAAPPCVAEVPPDSVCTADINSCGHASACGCDDGYSYNPALGKCILNLEGVAEATFTVLDDDDCNRPTTGECTRDINACGQPSQCSCAEGFAWNASAGKCVLVMN